MQNRPFQLWRHDQAPVLCNATVDVLRDRPVPLYEVQVQGLDPHDHRRTYIIEAKTDQAAATEGIARFTDEMEALS